MIEDASQAFLKAQDRGEDAPAPSLKARLELGIYLARRFKDDEEAFLDALENVVGSGPALSEWVPSALSIAYYSKDMEDAIRLAEAYGGQASEIGAAAAGLMAAKE
jgi:ADP-ribosylglycohydrolase